MHTLASYMVASRNTAEDEQHTTQKDYQVNFFLNVSKFFWCHVISYHSQGTPLVLLFQQCCFRLACTEENISYQNVIKIYGMYIHICQICHIQKYRWHTSMLLFRLFWWFFSSKQILPDIKIYFCDICKTPQQLFVCLFL